VGVLASLAFVSGFALRGVPSESLVLGLLLVGISLSANSWAGVHAIVMRILGHQARVTIARALVAGPTVGAFAVGFFVSGVSASLTAGFVTLTVAAPLVFSLSSRPVYRLT